MKRMLARTGRAVATLTAGALLAGCQFAIVPPKKHAAASGSPAPRCATRMAPGCWMRPRCSPSAWWISPGCAPAPA